MNKLPKPIKINVVFKGEIADVVGKAEEMQTTSEGLEFIFFFHFLFTSYPEIPQNYPPGVLRYLLNGKPPQNETILKDGDELVFYI